MATGRQQHSRQTSTCQLLKKQIGLKQIQNTENENSEYTRQKWEAMSASINFSIIHGHAGIPCNLLLKSVGWKGLFLRSKLLSPHNSIKASEACPRKLDIATNQQHSAVQTLAALSVHPECNWKLFTGKWLLITQHKVSLWHVGKHRAPYSWRQCWPERWSCWGLFWSKLAAEEEATVTERGDTRRISREPPVNRQIALGTRWKGRGTGAAGGGGVLCWDGPQSRPPTLTVLRPPAEPAPGVPDLPLLPPALGRGRVCSQLAGRRQTLPGPRG